MGSSWRLLTRRARGVLGLKGRNTYDGRSLADDPEQLRLAGSECFDGAESGSGQDTPGTLGVFQKSSVAEPIWETGRTRSQVENRSSAESPVVAALWVAHLTTCEASTPASFGTSVAGEASGVLTTLQAL